MALLERLQILIDADAKGAQREFENIGRTADKELGKAEDRIGRTSARLQSLGTAAAIGGGAVAVGLFKLAQMSEDAETQTRKLNNSIANSDQAFRNNGAALSAQAAALQKVTAADGDAIVGTDAYLVSMGLTEAQITKLNPLLVDLARKSGVDLDTAAKAAVKGIDGTAKGLRTLGVDVDGATLKAGGFNAVIDGISAAAGGFAENEGKTLSGQLEILKNNLGDLGEAVGGGAASIISPLVKGVGDLSGAIGSANPAVGDAAGKIAAIGSAAAISLGGLSVLTGQALKLRDTFTTLGDDGARSMTKIGTAASGIAIGAALIAGALALDAALTAATVSAGDLEKNINDLKSAATAGDALDALIEQTRELDGGWQDVKEQFAGRTPLYVDLNGVDVDIANLDKALGNLANSGDWEGLRAAIGAVESAQVSAADAPPIGGRGGQQGVKEFGETVDKYSGQLGSADKAAKAAADGTGAFADATGDAAGATDAAVSSYQAADDSLKAYADALKVWNSAADSAAAGGKAFTDAIERSSTLDDAISSASKLGAVYKTFGADIKNLPGDIDQTKLALGGYNEEQTKSINALVSAGDANASYLSGLVAQGATAEDVRNKADLLRVGYVDQAAQLGLNAEQTQQYLDVLGLTPGQVETAIKLSGDEEARFKIQAYQSLIADTPLEKLTEFYAAINAGDYQRAAAALDALSNPRTVEYTFVAIDAGGFGIGGKPGPPVPTKKGRKMGGPVTPGQPYQVNELGKEMFTPSTPGFITTAADSQRLFAGLEELLKGGGAGAGVQVNQNFTNPDPYVTAAESARAMRSAVSLARR